MLRNLIAKDITNLFPRDVPFFVQFIIVTPIYMDFNSKAIFFLRLYVSSQYRISNRKDPYAL